MSGTLFLLPNAISEGEETKTLPEATLDVARRCSYFLTENAKSARAYLKRIGHPKPLRELDVVEIGHVPDPKRIDAWIAPILEGVDGCIVSESGCPSVADPGSILVRRSHEAGIRVVPLVGPCSILLTLMASGLDGQRFRFWGYLPIEEAQLHEAIVRLERESRAGESEIFIETPYRNNRMLEALTRHLKPTTLLTVAVDVTGTKESIRTLKASEWQRYLGTLEKVPTVFALLAA